MIKDRILDEHGRGALKRSALNLSGGEAVLRSIIMGGKYRHALEIGTYKGASAACLAQHCERVTTIDLIDGRLEATSPHWDRQAFWASLGLDNIDLRLVKDDAEKASLIGSLDFDFAFIDGDHMAPHPANDFALVQRCGAVLFHDFDGVNDVSKFVATLPKRQVKIIDIFALWTKP